MKKLVFAVVALAMLVAFTGMAMADDPVNQTPETQGIDTQTVVYCLGTTTENDNIVWTQSSEYIGNSPPLQPTERYYVMSYTEDTIMDNGYGEYTKQMSTDTQNKVANQFNFEATKQVDFVQVEEGYGYITTEESLLLDGAANASATADKFICPFAATTYANVPQYCNVVEMGSSFDGYAVSMLTDAEERHVMATADPGVAMNYGVALEGVGTAAAWINAHIMEGRDATTGKAIDLTYSELTTASGTIIDFEKVMNYESGIRRF